MIGTHHCILSYPSRNAQPDDLTGLNNARADPSRLGLSIIVSYSSRFTSHVLSTREYDTFQKCTAQQRRLAYTPVSDNGVAGVNDVCARTL